MARNDCDPDSVHGPYQQTLFLGCSVLGFTATAGWNGQTSELTIELMEDDCEGEKKTWADKFPYADGKFKIHRGPDPGFTKPNIGAPAYFRVENFEYSGLIQTWDIKNSTNGKPRYTVKLVDPRVILDHTQVILDSYQQTQFDIYNLINVYGYLEWRGYPCKSLIIDGVGTGSPARGFAGSYRTDRGLPWVLVKKALQDLAGGGIGIDRPAGIGAPARNIRYIKEGGLHYIGPTTKGHGELFDDGIAVENDKISYVLDISELPQPLGPLDEEERPDAFDPLPSSYQYRITGPVLSLTDIIEQVCQDAGCDYFVELLPTKEPFLFIKVRVINRTDAIFPLAANVNPAITNFVDHFKVDGADGRGVLSDVLGRELRPEVNSSFLVGASTRQYFSQKTPFTLDYNKENSGDDGELIGEERPNPYNITPFWGYDTEGKLLQSRDNVRNNPAIDRSGWEVFLDFRKINLALFNPISLDLYNNAYGWVGENEIRLALGDFISFETTILNAWYPNTVLKRYFGETLGTELTVVRGRQPEAMGQASVVIEIKPGTESDIQGDPSAEKARDRKTMFNWLQSYATDIYGKHFLIQAPAGVCSAPNTSAPDGAAEPYNTIFTEVPSPEGGWPTITRDIDGGIEEIKDSPKVLGITNPSRDSDLFRDDIGKWSPIIKYIGSPGSYDEGALTASTEFLNSNDYLVGDLPACADPAEGEDPTEAENSRCIWVKGTVGESWVRGCPVSGIDGGWTSEAGSTIATWEDGETWSALVTIPAPVTRPNAQWSFGSRLAPVENIGKARSAVDVTTVIKEHPGGSTETVLTIAPEAVLPRAGGIPLLSLTRSYGPWRKVGKNPGAVSCEIDEGFAPWEYGSIDDMNKGALAKLSQSSTEMQVVERGQVQTPGYPEVSLGAALFMGGRAPLFFADRVVKIGNNNYPLRAGESLFRHIDLNPPAPLPEGVNVSSVNVAVGAQGVNTTYTISTFTPVFGRFSRGNAERLKQLGLDRAREARQRRAGKALKRLLKLAEDRSIAAGIKTAAGVVSPSTPNIALVGKLTYTTDVGGTGPTADEKQISSRKIAMGVDKHTLPNYGDYNNTSMMTYDGFFRPVSNYGGGQELVSPQVLPKIATNSGECLLTQSDGPPPPVETYTGLTIVQKYLDFLADPTSNPTFMTSDRANSSTSGHDVEGVARKSLTWLKNNQNDKSDSLLFFQSGQNTTYAEDYRYMAMRGPLVMQAWGYDIHGKPIPNKKSGSDGSGSFQSSYDGLEDGFKENWLADARNWPVAPIDLRFDRKRGVWTVPSAFRLYQIKAKAEIAPNSVGRAEIIKYKDDIIKDDGSTISNPEINVENWTDVAITGNQKALAYYDTAECAYWALPSFSGGGPGGSGVGIGCDETSVSSCESPLSATPIYNKQFITFGENLNAKEHSIDDKDGVIVSATSSLKIGVVGNCVSPPIECTAYDCLNIGDGLNFNPATSTITGPKIKNTDDCYEPAPQVYKNFNKLAFGGGLTLSQNPPEGNCAYVVNGPMVAQDATCYRPTEGVDPEDFEAGCAPIEGAYFEKLTFGPGLCLAPTVKIPFVQPKCEYTITGPKIRSPHGATCSDKVDDPVSFSTLVVGGSLTVKDTSSDAYGNCAYLIQGPTLSKSEDKCSDGFTGKHFSNLTFGQRLRTTASDMESANDSSPDCWPGVTVSGPPLTVGKVGSDVTKIKMAKCEDETADGKKLGPLIAVDAKTNSEVATAGESCGQTVKLGTTGYDDWIDVVVDVSCDANGNIVYNTKRLTFCGGLLQTVTDGYPLSY